MRIALIKCVDGTKMTINSFEWIKVAEICTIHYSANWKKIHKRISKSSHNHTSRRLVSNNSFRMKFFFCARSFTFYQHAALQFIIMIFEHTYAHKRENKLLVEFFFLPNLSISHKCIL